MKWDCPDHPKTAALAMSLEIAHYSAVGILELMFHFTAKYAPTGDLTRYLPDALAGNVRWERPPSELVAGLVACGWIDAVGDRHIVHDWSQHADYTVHNKLARASLKFADGTEPSLSRLPQVERMEILKRECSANALQTLGARSASVRQTLGARSARSYPSLALIPPNPQTQTADPQPGTAITLRDGSAWSPPPELLAALQAAHPYADLQQQLASAAAWCIANPAKRKTRRGAARFFSGWVQTNAAGNLRPPGQPPTSGNGQQRQPQAPRLSGSPLLPAGFRHLIDENGIPIEPVSIRRDRERAELDRQSAARKAAQQAAIEAEKAAKPPA